MPADLGKRFDELLSQAEAVESSKKTEWKEYGTSTYVDSTMLLNWQVKVRHLVSAVCGPDSQHFKMLEKAEETSMFTTNHDIFQKMKAVLLAAKEDYDGGYLSRIKDLIHAAVFDDELEQAEELLTACYHIPAAVVAGVVLETRLRQLCEDKGISIGKLDKMNADLTKAEKYNKLVQKQITALADIRNNAAHGRIDQFKAADVANMIRDVRNLLAGYLS